ncbi:MAG TPA: 30S ribosomal protein S9 [Acidobacteriota bacterium]|nr:30S ribosomal protein S9 [Acidobacteriota bacterium]
MKIVQASGKRKRAVARATIRSGKGNVKINHIPLAQVTPRYTKMKIEEALILARDHAKSVDVEVLVAGGGINGQAEASRIAICRGLVDFTKNEDLRQTYLGYDRQLLVNDVRRKEQSKPNRHGKARSKVQKSYR